MRFFKSLAVFAVVICIALLSVPAGAVSIAPRIQSGTFGFVSLVNDEDHEEPYFYSDDYFSQSGKERNEHLRTFSFDLALSAFGNEKNNPNGEYVVKLLEGVGFSRSDARADDYDVKPTSETIATLITHKKTEFGEVIAVAVRGSGYDTEWENNLRIGKNGDAEGFSEAAGKVIGRIKDYEKKYGLSGAKIWMSGYSRGGGVSDLAGKYINEHTSEFGLTDDDIYIYTFEAPKVSGTECGYKNIHNVYDPNDIVPNFYSANWGLYNSGVGEALPSDALFVNCKQLEISLKGIDFKDKKNVDKIAMSDAEEQLVGWLTGSVSREYFSDHSSGICDLAALIFTGTESGGDVTKFISDAFNNGLSSDVSSALTLTKIFSDKKTEEEAITILSEMLAKMIDASDHSNILSDAEYEILKKATDDIAYIIVPLLREDRRQNEHFENISTLAGNIGEILLQHFSENLINFIKAEDDYFDPASLKDAEINIDETTADVVSVKVGGKVLKPGTDYGVSYLDSAGAPIEPEESGEYTAIITGVGSYSETAEKTFVAQFPHRHHWVFDPHGGTVTVKCMNKECDYGTGKEYGITLSVKDKTYDGLAAEASFAKSEGFPTELETGRIGFLPEDGELTYDAPVMPGKYRVSLEIVNSGNREEHAFAECDITIETIALTPEKTVIEMKDNSPEAVSVTFGGKRLEEGTDYALLYYDKDGNEIARPESAGNYKLTVKGEKIYSGEITKDFSINDNLPLLIIIPSAAVAAGVCLTLFVVKNKRGKNKTEK